ncbi:MAG: PAS domain S-box protein [Taibaiella sp.]|nr:PAS domain S-box protein [Taibaiella sp.]
MRLARVTAVHLGSLVLIIGVLKFFDLTGLTNLEFDKWLFYDELNTGESFRTIAPNSALLLMLCGFILFNAYRSSRPLLLINDITKVAGFLVSYLAIIGYVYNLEVTYRVGAFVPMALNTAIAYLSFFSVALIEMPPGNFMRVAGSGFAGGRMARKAIPIILLIPLLFGYLRLMGEKAQLFESTYGTVLESAFMVFLVLIFVYLYARRLNQEDEKRHLAEAQIAKSEQKYRTLVNALREGVIYYDTNGRISFCNHGFSVLFGYTEEEIKGKDVFELFIKDELHDTYRSRLRDIAKGKSETFEENVKARDGRSIWVSISASPVYNDKAELIAGLATVVDVTEQKKQMEDIEAFSASAAHDLNAPLARIEMIALLLLDEDGQLNDDNLELLRAIAGITANMRGLLRDLLQFSKLGVTDIKRSALDTTGIVNEVLQANSHINPHAKVKLLPLPPMNAEKVMITQVFTNLISNALKYSSNTPDPEIEIGHIAESDAYYVKDNGAGFNMADTHKLFAAFQRLHIEFEGNGLGLPIVKRIIEKHGGSIWAESAPGKGAVFYFKLS